MCLTVMTTLKFLLSVMILCCSGITALYSKEEFILSSQSPAKPSFLYILIDDIGWADLSYNGGTARTPNIDAWSRKAGSIKMMDFHAYTLCSPTRASILTGRNHFRDCVDHTYGCRDMSFCVPDFEFAPSRTFTVGDAVRAAGPEYSNGGVYFAGKWHLGSFNNDSEAYGGITSSPITHGFQHFHATVGVAPTRTVNCQCKKDWEDRCEFGHYQHQAGCKNMEKCCLNYWWDDAKEPHGVTNLTRPTDPDDSLYLVDTFRRFLLSRRRMYSVKNKMMLASDPFFAQISFHNCHIPFIGSKKARAACAANQTCIPPKDGQTVYNDEELDYYACLTQLDDAIGKILQILEDEGFYDNTMIWFSSDNGPEKNCPPEGICRRANDDPQRPIEGPGSAGILRGRKRDIYEGGHRVLGIISWPAYIIDRANPDYSGNLVSWEIVSVVDFLPTVMDVLAVARPKSQSLWSMDGKSILPILRGGKWVDVPDGGTRELGIGFYDPTLAVVNGWGYRYGRWKYVDGSASCKVESCRKPQLFDLENDLGERNDLSDKYPEILFEIQSRFLLWHRSVILSRTSAESNCTTSTHATEELTLPFSLQNIKMR